MKKKIKKRGATHVDWVMSIGIFLIYLLALFIIIKPGVREIYTGDTLLFILEDNFKENIVWTIKETPLFIKNPCSTQDSTTPQVKLELIGTDWKFSKVEPEPSEYGEYYELTNYSFLIQDSSISARDYFLTYYPTIQNPSRPNLKLTTQLCDTELGITEEIEGLSEEWLNDLQTQNYEDVKTAWGYPKGGEFSIYITEIG